MYFYQNGLQEIFTFVAVGVAAGFVAITNSAKWMNIVKYIQTKMIFTKTISSFVENSTKIQLPFNFKSAKQNFFIGIWCLECISKT